MSTVRDLQNLPYHHDIEVVLMSHIHFETLNKGQKGSLVRE